jgi:HAD superfamily hydrolase (TIGR01484 family)
MRPLQDFTHTARCNISFVLTDIDDTLTNEGRLPAKSYVALEQLRAAGLIVIPVTGRPAGWCDLIARQWPVDGIIGENGAFSFRYDDDKKVMLRRYAADEITRQNNRVKLEVIRKEVLQTVKGCAVSADQAYREADLAIDFCEDVPALNRDDVQRIVSVFERHGATAKVSSIHVNGWFGSYDKLSMARIFLQEQFGISVDTENEKIVFAGDSPNDSPMFGFFKNSVGVANVKAFEDTLPAKPSWVTEGFGASGFVELAQALLAARK